MPNVPDGEGLQFPGGVVPLGQVGVFKVRFCFQDGHQHVIRSKPVQNVPVFIGCIAFHHPWRLEYVLWRHMPHLSRQMHHFLHWLALLTETEIDLCQLFHFFETSAGNAFLAHLVDVGKGQFQNGFLIFKALRGQRHVQFQGGFLAGIHAATCGQAFHQASLLKNVKQAARAFVAKQAGNVVGRLVAVVVFLRRDGEGERQVADILQRIRMHAGGQGAWAEQWLVVDLRVQVAVFDAVEAASYHGLELIQRLWAVDGKRHQVGRVMGFPEVDQVRAQGALFGVFQGGQVTDGKLVERVVGIADGLFYGVEATAVVFLF